jgi:hypothetical protein
MSQRESAESPFFCFACELHYPYERIAFGIESMWRGGRPCAKHVCKGCQLGGMDVAKAYAKDTEARLEWGNGGGA